MENGNWQTYILIFFALWLFVLSAFLIRIYLFFRKLSKDIDKGSLIKVLDRIFRKEKDLKNKVSDLSKNLSVVEQANFDNIKKVGLVKFNPFEELGGDHSFALCILNGHESGFVLTSLHTRERTRVYIKEVRKGESKYDLSKEEQGALKKALD